MRDHRERYCDLQWIERSCYIYRYNVGQTHHKGKDEFSWFLCLKQIFGFGINKTAEEEDDIYMLGVGLHHKRKFKWHSIPCKDDSARFTTVLRKPLTDLKCGR